MKRDKKAGNHLVIVYTRCVEMLKHKLKNNPGTCLVNNKRKQIEIAIQVLNWLLFLCLLAWLLAWLDIKHPIKKYWKILIPICYDSQLRRNLYESGKSRPHITFRVSQRDYQQIALTEIIKTFTIRDSDNHSQGSTYLHSDNDYVHNGDNHDDDIYYYDYKAT
uniref:Uncharacterized protein n=1 Tax=Glossina brevipalpis TaxID=37001 RepID=A0A1A9W8K5_9MUSC